MRDGMTLEEMEAAGKRAEAIRAAEGHLKNQRFRLDLINKFGKAGNVWRPSLRLKGGTGYTPEAVIDIDIPFGVIQQSAVDAVRRAERELIKLGGMP